MKPGGRTDHPIELLSASLDRELQVPEAGALEAHLEGCADCRGLLGDFRRLDQAMASEPPATVPADLRQRILERLPPRAVAPVKSWWRQAMPLAAAASLVMAVLLWYGRPDRLPPLSESTASKSDGNPVPQAPLPLPLATDRPSPTAADSIILGNDAKSRPAPPPVVEKGKATASVPSESFGFAAPKRSQAAPPRPAPAPAAPPAQAEPSKAQSPKQAEHAFEEAAARNWKVEKDAAKDAEKGNDKGPAASTDGDLAERLRALGYVGNGEDMKKEPQPAAASPADSSESRREIERKELAELQARTVREDALRRVAPPAAQAALGAFGLLATPYRIRLDAERRMSVVTGPFTCVVTIDDVDARTVTTAIQESARAVDASKPIARDPDGTVVLPATPAAREAVLRLVRERYRSALESRCGPLPE